jgi:hypothetical protein
MENLTGDPAYERVRRDLWNELQGYLRGQGDPRVYGEGDRFDRYEYVGKAQHSWKAWVEGTWEPQGY